MCIRVTKTDNKDSGISILTFEVKTQVKGCDVTIPGWRAVIGKDGRKVLDIHEPNHQFGSVDKKTGKPVIDKETKQQVMIRMSHVQCEEILQLKGALAQEIKGYLEVQVQSAAKILAKAQEAAEQARLAEVPRITEASSTPQMDLPAEGGDDLPY